MKKLLTILLVNTLFYSCSNDSENCCAIPSNSDFFHFSVLNAEGNDLLDPSTEGSLNTSKIKIFTIENGERVEYSKPLMDSPKGYDIVKEGEVYTIMAAIGKWDEKLENIGIISWNDIHEDTITLKYAKAGENLKRVVQIFYNGEEVWNEEEAGNESIVNGRFFQIIKP